MVCLPVTRVVIKKVSTSAVEETEDVLAAEEPLEIRIEYGPMDARIQKSISVTMRTPGSDFELASGFLYTEGIIAAKDDIAAIHHCNGAAGNVVKVQLAPAVSPDMEKLDRHFYTTSSCGVCGKSSIEAVRVARRPVDEQEDGLRFSPSLIYRLPELLRDQQELFAYTGGLHGCALFNTEGQLLVTREDVGRHNAVDKLIGYAMQKDMLPLNDHILLLSGRASFELVQKATMAGIRATAAVGAPSTLAVQMAEENKMTLIGFLRGARFNIYSGAQRVII